MKREERLAEALERFVTWGGLWLAEKERRENYAITPGTLPPSDFIDRPKRLNELLEQLTIEGREVLDARLSVNEGGVAPVEPQEPR